MTHAPARPRDLPCDVRVGPVDPGPERRWPTWCRVLLAAVIMLASTLSVVLPAFIPGAGDLADTVRGWPLVALATLQYSIPVLAAAGLVWSAMRFVDRRPMRDTGWRFNGRSLPSLALATALTVALTVAAGLVADLTGTLRPDPNLGQLPAAMELVLRGVAMGFLMQGIPEELVWRGYVMQTLRTSPVVTAYISAAAFGAMHLVSSGGQEGLLERLVYLAPPTAFGLLAAALVLRTGSLWAAFGVHGGSHLGTAIGGIYLGIGEGPALWIAQTIPFLTVALWLLHRRSLRRGSED